MTEVVFQYKQKGTTLFFVGQFLWVIFLLLSWALAASNFKILFCIHYKIENKVFQEVILGICKQTSLLIGNKSLFQYFASTIFSSYRLRRRRYRAFTSVFYFFLPSFVKFYGRLQSRQQFFTFLFLGSLILPQRAWWSPFFVKIYCHTKIKSLKSILS